MAKKCVHCDSFLNWKKYFALSNTILALIVALLSTTSTLYLLIKPSLIEQNSAISINYGGVEDGNLIFIAINSGNKPGAVAKVFFAYRDRHDREISIPRDYAARKYEVDGNFFVVKSISIFEKSENFLIESEKAGRIVLDFGVREMVGLLGLNEHSSHEAFGNFECSFFFDIVDFYGELNILERKFNCSELRYELKGL